MKKKSIAFLDILGISTASLCLVHCIFFPLLSIIPFGLFHNYWIDIFFVSIGLFIVSKILQSNTSKKIKLIFTFSILTISIGVILEIIWTIDTLFVLLGGIGMIIGHVLNYKSHSK